MSSAPTTVIVGTGQAGGWAAVTLRAEGFTGRIVVVGEESHPPYERPPLSKGVLSKDEAPETCHLRPADSYGEQSIELRLGVRATGLDRAARRVALTDGETLDYDTLLLATGSRVRRLPVPGADGPGVHYLRTIDDALAIRARLTPQARLCVVGGGYIGLEVAASARQRGCAVTILEMEDVVMKRVVPAEVGRFYDGVHREHGVDIRLGQTVTRIEDDGAAQRVVCADGTEVAADIVVVGVGIIPNAELADAAGLDVDNGILVDELGRTSDPHVFAAGDVTNHVNPVLGRRVRLESWQNAQNQAIAVARAMCGGQTPYGEVPWFWSDQYDLNLQMVGLADRWDQVVVRGDMDSRRFVVVCLADGRVVTGNGVNSARDVRYVRRMIEKNSAVDPAALADPEVPLKSLV